MNQGAKFGAVLVIVVVLFGGIEYYTYQTLENQQSAANAQISTLQGNLAVASTLIQNLTSSVRSLEAKAAASAPVGVFQVNYVGDGQPGHEVAVPFEPVQVVIVDINTGVRATVYHGVNNTWDNIFNGLSLYQADYSYGIGSFYHDGLYNISWIGSAPVGTMNIKGDNYSAFFYP